MWWRSLEDSLSLTWTEQNNTKHQKDLFPPQLPKFILRWVCCPLQLTLHDTGSQNGVRRVRKEGETLVGMERKGTWLAAEGNYIFHCWISCLCSSVNWLYRGCGGRKTTHKRHNKMGKAGSLWFLNLFIPFRSFWSKMLPADLKNTKHLFFLTDMTPLLIHRPKADIRLGCVAANRLLAHELGTLSISEKVFHFPRNTLHLSGHVFSVYT